MSTPTTHLELSGRWETRLRVAVACGVIGLAAPHSLAGQQSTVSEPLPPVPQAKASISVSVRRVVVDVVVTDSKGRVVAGLKKDDFRVSENGKPQQIRSFDQHSQVVQEPVPAPQLPSNTFSNFSTVNQSGPVTVILYDLLNTPLDAQPYAHAQLLSFLKNRKSSGQVAIFVLSDKLHMLQGFTDDENQLIAALDRQKGRYKSPNLQTSEESRAGSDQLTRTAGNQNGADDPATANPSFQAVTAMLQHMETMEASYDLDQRVGLTVEAMEGIARFLIGLPGRKNLIWLSGSFPSGIVPDEAVGGRDSFEVTRNYSQTLVEATDLLNLSHVAVYPVDVRGLQVNPMFSAASNQTYEPGTGRDLKAVRAFTQQQNTEHSTMELIGSQTGGRAFYNTNGLKEAVSTAVEEGSDYYTVTYSPTDTALDGKVRRIHVDLLRPGYQLSYRKTYFADKIDDAVARTEKTPEDPLAVTLEHGAPPARELFFEAHVQTFGPVAPATPDEMNVLEQYEAHEKGGKKNAALLTRKPVPMQRYVISYGLLLRQLALPAGADGVRHGNLEFAVMSYNDDGKTLNGIRTKVNDVIQPERYARLVNSGYQLLQTVNVPVQAVSLRIAVRDVSTNRLGSIEVRLPLAPDVKGPEPAPKNP